MTGDPLHGFYQYKLQMNHGKMNKVVAWTDAGGLPMGHYETKKLPLYPYARSYTLADNYFAGAFGESMLNTSGCSALAPRSGRTHRKTWWRTRGSTRRVT